MAAPDFGLSRRQLRRVRIQDALGLERDGVNVRMYRDRLLEELARAADVEGGFDTLDETTVDTVVSLAVAELDEQPIDTLVVVLLCIRVLAADGQFARLALLADRLGLVGRRFEVERPFLSLACDAFSKALKSQERQATTDLESQLGLGRRKPDQSVSRSRESLDDLLVATALRSCLAGDRDGLAVRARSALMRQHDGLAMSFVDAVIAWSAAAEVARPGIVLEAVDATFQTPRLRNYLRRRGIPVLFPAQMKALAAGATLDQDVVVSLPTSSGKTLIAEFRIAATLERTTDARAIYVAPYRLLARQVEFSMGRGLSSLGHSVRDLGSGYDPEVDLAGGQLPDVSVCTPERLDALMRAASAETESGQQTAELFASCRVLVFDELQLVGRPGRGPRFELILSRLRLRYPHVRILGLSAASQGADDVAVWLTGSEAIAGAKRPTGTLEIVWEVDGPLKQRAGRNVSTVATLERGSQAADDATSLILRLNARYRPVLAVETSRPQAEGLAKRLVERAPAAGAEWRDNLTASESEDLAIAIEEVKALLGDSHPLPMYMQNGIAFHHAGVPTHALQQIERLASKRLLRVVCATTTVAEGADLPFRAVVIPHLNFQSASGRLERDLYLNIIGRAGRANVSVEGVVFVLDSSARTLQNVVRASLWSNTTHDRIRGRLSTVDTTLRNIEDWSNYNDVQSQVMGWLGDGGSYVAEQAEALAASTLSWQFGERTEQLSVVDLIDDALADLETNGYALAASPYKLTERGRSARLTGLAVPSIQRLEKAISVARDGWLRDLVGLTEVHEEIAEHMARLVFESIETVENSLWLKRTAKNDAAKFRALSDFGDGDNSAFHQSEEYQHDTTLLASWILGTSYPGLAEIAPIYDRANSIFGGSDLAKRTSDATEYVGKLTYPASWTWSGVRVLAGELSTEIPSFLRTSIEYGVPSAAAGLLIQRSGITRPAALTASALAGTTWDEVVEWLTSDDFGTRASPQFTTSDQLRLTALRDRLLLSH